MPANAIRSFSLWNMFSLSLPRLMTWYQYAPADARVARAISLAGCQDTEFDASSELSDSPVCFGEGQSPCRRRFQTERLSLPD